MAIRAIARAVVTDEVGHAAQRHSSFEARGVTENPVGHVPAITATRDAQTIGIDPGILRKRRIHARHHVLIVHASPVVHDSTLELLAVARGAARITEKDRPALARVNLKLVKPVDAVLAGRPAMD